MIKSNGDNHLRLIDYLRSNHHLFLSLLLFFLMCCLADQIFSPFQVSTFSNPPLSCWNIIRLHLLRLYCVYTGFKLCYECHLKKARSQALIWQYLKLEEVGDVSDEFVVGVIGMFQRWVWAHDCVTANTASRWDVNGFRLDVSENQLMSLLRIRPDYFQGLNLIVREINIHVRIFFFFLFKFSKI